MRRTFWQGSAGRVLMELLYGTEGIDRQGMCVYVDRAQMSARLRITKGRLERVLEWLESQKLISNLDIRYKTFRATLRPVADVRADIVDKRGAN